MDERLIKLPNLKIVEKMLVWISENKIVTEESDIFSCQWKEMADKPWQMKKVWQPVVECRVC